MRKDRVIIFATIATLMWGSAFPFVKIGYHIYGISNQQVNDILVFAGVRFVLAGIIVLFMASIVRRRIMIPTIKESGKIFLLGIIQITMQYIFFYIGVANTSGVKSSILYSVNTIIAVMLSHFIYSEDRINAKKILGCTLGLLGVVVLNAKDFQLGVISFSGEGAVLMAAAFFAIGGIVNKGLVAKTDKYIVTSYQLLFGGAALMLMGKLSGGNITVDGADSVAILLYLAIISSIAFLIWSYLLEKSPASQVVIYNFLIPIFGVLISAIVLGEKIDAVNSGISLILVCVGILLVCIDFSGHRKRKGT